MLSLREFRYAARVFLGRYPALYFPIVSVIRRPDPIRFVRRNSQLVIEGYGRSANTFVTTGIKHAQNGNARIASHHHVPAQIIRGAKLGVPALVLIRNPEDAVASLRIYSVRIAVRVLLWDYATFYETLLPHKDGFVTATFEACTRHLDKVVAAVNDRFQSRLVVPNFTDEDIQEIFRQLEEQNRRIGGNSEATVPRPSPERAEAKEDALAEIRSPQHRKALDRAKAVYEQFISETNCV